MLDEKIVSVFQKAIYWLELSPLDRIKEKLVQMVSMKPSERLSSKISLNVCLIPETFIIEKDQVLFLVFYFQTKSHFAIVFFPEEFDSLEM